MGYVGFAVAIGLVAGPAVGGALSQKEFYFYACSLYQKCCEPGTAACFPDNATLAAMPAFDRVAADDLGE